MTTKKNIKKDSIIIDNDPRTNGREGIVLEDAMETNGRVRVRWATGRVTLIEAARIHDDGKPRKTGYSVKSRGAE